MPPATPPGFSHIIMGNRCGTTVADDCDVLSLKSDDPPEYSTKEAPSSRMDVVFHGLCKKYVRCLQSGEEISPPLKNALRSIYEVKFNAELTFGDADLPVCVLRYLDAHDNGIPYVHKTTNELKAEAVIACGKSTSV